MKKEEYERLKKQNDEASRTGDYSKMIMMGSDTYILMKEYEQSVCRHGNITTQGGMNICGLCDKML